MDRKPAERLAELIDTLKPLPQVATLVIEKCNDPKAGAREIADTLKSDPAFTTKLLSVANSVFYRGEREIRTVQEAVTRIGLRTIKHVVYSTAIYNLFSKNDRTSGFDREAFWLHSLSVAVSARGIARMLGGSQDEAFTTGLLHDIGKLIIDQASTERIGDSTKTKLEAVILGDQETLIDGFDPAEVGFRAAKKWNLPLAIQKAIAYLRLEDLDFLESEEEQTFVRVVQAANALCEDVESLNQRPHLEVLEAYAERFSLSVQEVSEFLDEVRSEVGETAALFELKEADVHRYFDALAIAQNELLKSKSER